MSCTHADTHFPIFLGNIRFALKIVVKNHPVKHRLKMDIGNASVVFQSPPVAPGVTTTSISIVIRGTACRWHAKTTDTSSTIGKKFVPEYIYRERNSMLDYVSISQS